MKFKGRGCARLEQRDKNTPNGRSTALEYVSQAAVAQERGTRLDYGQGATFLWVRSRKGRKRYGGPLTHVHLVQKEGENGEWEEVMSTH